MQGPHTRGWVGFPSPLPTPQPLLAPRTELTSPRPPSSPAAALPARGTTTSPAAPTPRPPPAPKTTSTPTWSQPRAASTPPAPGKPHTPRHGVTLRCPLTGCPLSPCSLRWHPAGSRGLLQLPQPPRPLPAPRALRLAHRGGGRARHPAADGGVQRGGHGVLPLRPPGALRGARGRRRGASPSSGGHRQVGSGKDSAPQLLGWGREETLRDGPPRFCGNVVPPTFNTNSNLLRVTFVSDGSVGAPGFSARYRAVAPDESEHPQNLPRSRGFGAGGAQSTATSPGTPQRAAPGTSIFATEGFASAWASSATASTTARTAATRPTAA